MSVVSFRMGFVVEHEAGGFAVVGPVAEELVHHQ